MEQRGRSHPGYGSGPPRYPGTFLQALQESAAGMNWQVRRWGGDTVECVDGDGKSHVVGLENLYRRCRREPREQWPGLIADFLTAVIAADQEESLPAELAAVSDQLLVRLGRPFKKTADEPRIYAQPLAGTDLVVNLVIDYPNRMCYVTEDLVTQSGRPGPHWVECGLANLKTQTPADCFQVVHPESGLLLCSVVDAYDSSRALLLDRLLPEPAPAGWLVVLPGRDELLVLPVTLKAVPHFHLLKILAEKNYQSVPYPISDQVFWVYEGAWHPFPIDLRSKEVVVQPPAEFVKILGQLTPEEGPEKSGDGG